MNEQKSPAQSTSKDYSEIIHLTAPHSNIFSNITSFLDSRDYIQVKKTDKTNYRNSTKKTNLRVETLKTAFELTQEQLKNIPKEILPHLDLIFPVIKNIYRKLSRNEKNDLGDKPYAVLLELFYQGLLKPEFANFCRNTPALAYKVMNIPALQKLLPKTETISQFVPEYSVPNWWSRVRGAGLGFGIATVKAIRFGVDTSTKFAASLAISAFFLGVGSAINYFFTPYIPMPGNIAEFFTAFWPFWMPIAILTFLGVFAAEADTANAANRDRIANGQLPPQTAINNLVHHLADALNVTMAFFFDTYQGYKLGHRQILDNGNYLNFITGKSKHAALGSKATFMADFIPSPTVATMAEVFKFKYGNTLENLKIKEEKSDSSASRNYEVKSDSPTPRSYSALSSRMGGSVASSEFNPTEIEMITYASSSSIPLLGAKSQKSYGGLDSEENSSSRSFGFSRSDD